MSRVRSGYTLSATTALPFDEAVERVRTELKAEGFGVLCEIDVQATLRAKLGIETDRYLILGACNPSLAHNALEVEPELGVLLPCNVVVYERDGTTHIAAVDPERMLSIVENDDLGPVATEVRRRLGSVVDSVAVSRPALIGDDTPRGIWLFSSTCCLRLSRERNRRRPGRQAQSGA